MPDNYPDEAFYWSADAAMSATGGADAHLVLALEQAFATDIVPGDQMVFGRMRLRVDNLVAGAQYKLTFPFGVRTFTATTAGIKGINVTEDIGCVPGPGTPCNFAQALASPTPDPFLVWDTLGLPPAQGGPPPGYIGDPNVPHRVTGSPSLTNFFRLEGPNAGGPGIDILETDQFLLEGKIAGLNVAATPRGGAYNTPQKVRLFASDTSAIIYYTTDGSNPLDAQNPNRLTYASATPLDIQVDTTVTYGAEIPAATPEAAPVQSIVATETYTFDMVPPTLTVVPPGGAYNESQTVTVTASEPATIYYTKNSTDPTDAANQNRVVYNGPLVIASSTTLKIAAVDKVGNVSTIDTHAYVIDTTPPATPSVPDLITTQDTGASAADNITSVVQPTFRIVGEPNATLRLILDDDAVSGSALAPSTGIVTVPLATPLADGLHSIRSQAMDKAGNISLPSDELLVTIDSSAPAVVITNQPPAITGPSGQFTFGSSEAGLAYQCAFSTGTAVFATCTSPFPFTNKADGAYTFTVRGTDAAGNAGTATASVTVRAAALTATATPAGGTFNKAQTVTLTANDAAAKIFYTTDGVTVPSATTTPYTAPISIASTTTLQFVAIDAAGNKSPVGSQTYTIDTLAPTVTATPAGGTYTAVQNVVLASEAGASIFYSTTGPATTASTRYTGPIAIAATTTLSYLGVDALGNASLPVSQTYTINITTTPPPTPTAAAPVPSIVNHVTLTTTTVPVTLTWAGTPSASGSAIAKYELEQSVDGGPFTAITLPTALTTSVVRNIVPSNTTTYVFRVRATDAAGAVSAFAPAAPFAVRAVQESDPGLAYVGSWPVAARANAFGGSTSSNSVANSTASYTFTGRFVAWVTEKDPTHGQAVVSVDGVATPSIDNYNAGALTRRVMFVQAVTPGQHSIQVKVLSTKNAASTGTRTDLDAFIVIGDPAGPTTPGPTTTTISAPASINWPGPASVKVTVASASATPTGTVALTVDGVATSQPLSGGASTFSVGNLSLGTHTLSASYTAQAGFLASAAPLQNLVVNPAPTTTTISAPAVTAPANGVVTVTVAATGATPTGSVSLNVDGVTQPAQALVAGQATFTVTAPSVGTHALRASYGAQGTFAASTSAAASLVVNAAPATATPTTTSMTAPTVTSPANGVVTVKVVQTGTTTPATGTVRLTVDTAAPLSAALSAGVATFTVTSPTVGTHTLKADYAAQAGFGASSTTGALVVNSATPAAGPVAKAPVPSIVNHSTLTTTAVPVTLSWSATPAASGSPIAKYELQQSINGAAFTAVTLPSATATSVVLNLVPSATNKYVFRVRATDAAGAVGTFVPMSAGFTVIAAQENNTAVKYVGTWPIAARANAFGGSTSANSVANSTATYTFTGTYVAWVTEKDPSHGQVVVSVDGVATPTIDNYSASTLTRRVMLVQALAPGTHTIQVKVLATKNAASTGTRTDIDAFIVFGQ